MSKPTFFRQYEKHFKIITKTCLYNFEPLKPHFYIVKLGFIGLYIIFLISAQKHRLWVLIRTASVLSENFQFLMVKFLIYLNRRVFVMEVCRNYYPACQVLNTSVKIFMGTGYISRGATMLIAFLPFKRIEFIPYVSSSPFSGHRRVEEQTASQTRGPRGP